MKRLCYSPLQGRDKKGSSRFLISRLPLRLFSFLTIILAVPVFLLSCKSDHHKELSGKELQKAKDSIMATIERETRSFFSRDYYTWRSTFAQKDYDFQAWSNKDGTFDASVGWEGIDNTVGRYIHDNPEPQSSHPVVERKNIKFKFYGTNVAYLTWDQFNSTREGTMFYHSKELRLMESIDNNWKIVAVAAFWDYPNMISGAKLPDIEKMDKESRGSANEKLQ